ncbi:MAG: PIG-L family deacetylase [Ardenticatenales bacterium]|nr:PIG-L family deacetylase [Ardenticatenales bacterium]
MYDTFVPQRAMVIVAHPDDAEFSCSGTIARWVQAGCEVCYVLCTSGDVGIAEEGMTRARAIRIREAEQRAAAAEVGVTEVIFLREPDGMLEATMLLRKRLVREIRRFRPEVVIAGDPYLVFTPGGWINHPDHRAAALAAVDAIFPSSGQPHLFEELAGEGLRPHKIRKLYVIGFGDGDVYSDITGTIDRKIAALQAHPSQLGTWTDLADRIREWSGGAAKRAKEAHPDDAQIQAMDHAEAFRVFTVTGDEDWAKQGARHARADVVATAD